AERAGVVAAREAPDRHDAHHSSGVQRGARDAQRLYDGGRDRSLLRAGAGRDQAGDGIAFASATALSRAIWRRRMRRVNQPKSTLMIRTKALPRSISAE